MPYTVLTLSPPHLHLHTPPHTTPLHAHHLPPPFSSTTPPRSSLLSIRPPHILLATSSTLTFLSLHTPPHPHKSFSLPEPISALCTTAHHILAATPTGRIYVWNAQGALLALRQLFHGHVHALAITDDDLLLAAVDTIVHAVSLASLFHPAPPLIISLKGHTLPITSLAAGFASASMRCVTASADRTARIWHLPSATCLATLLLPAPGVGAALAKDESVAYVAARTGHVFAVDVAALAPGTVLHAARQPRGVTMIRGPRAEVRGMDLVHTEGGGAHLLLACADAMEIIDCATAAVVARYTRHGTAGVPVVKALEHGIVGAAIPHGGPGLPNGMGRALVSPEDVRVRVAGGASSVSVSADAWVWQVFDVAWKRAFEKQHAVQQITLEQRESDRERAMRQEIDALERRNQQLEMAGRRLIQLVESEQAT